MRQVKDFPLQFLVISGTFGILQNSYYYPSRSTSVASQGN